MFTVLCEMISDIQFTREQPSSVENRIIPMSLKSATDSDCQLTDSDGNMVAKQLCEARGSVQNPIAGADLLMQMFGSFILSNPSREDDMAFISSAKPLKPYLVASRGRLSPSISVRRVSLILLMNISTIKMAAQDMCSLAYFGHVIIKISIKLERFLKRDMSQFGYLHTSVDRQDVWAMPTTMETFGICANGLESAV